MRLFQQVCLVLGLAALMPLVAGLALGSSHMWGPAAAVACVGVAVGIGSISGCSSYQFTAWIVAGVTLAMIYPERFLQLGSIDLRNKTLILILIQLVMFGMGTQMKLHDFAGILNLPHAVLVGIALQFTVMPLVGFALANMLYVPPEVAAGIVLIGSCSSGLASNVMTFIAKANLPLSITLTSCTTLLAPIATPLWMKLLAGKMIAVDFASMMMEIVKLIIVPIGAAMLADYLAFASPRIRKIVSLLAAAVAVVFLAAAFGGWQYLVARLDGYLLKAVVVLGFSLGAVVAGVVYFVITQRMPQVASIMPACSMFGIIYVTSVTVAAGRDRLLVIGLPLLLAVVIHNSAGYLLGYWLSRACRLDEKSARTVALEVGLQNGGMATAIAASLNQLATLGLAAAVFNPWMNFSGSVLANYWRRRHVVDNSLGETPG